MKKDFKMNYTAKLELELDKPMDSGLFQDCLSMCMRLYASESKTEMSDYISQVACHTTPASKDISSDGWISVEDGIPHDTGTVWVILDNGAVGRGYCVEIGDGRFYFLFDAPGHNDPPRHVVRWKKPDQGGLPHARGTVGCTPVSNVCKRGRF